MQLPLGHVGGTNVVTATIQAPVSLSQNGGFEFDLLLFQRPGRNWTRVRPHCTSIFEINTGMKGMSAPLGARQLLSLHSCPECWVISP